MSETPRLAFEGNHYSEMGHDIQSIWTAFVPHVTTHMHRYQNTQAMTQSRRPIPSLVYAGIILTFLDLASNWPSRILRRSRRRSAARASEDIPNRINVSRTPIRVLLGKVGIPDGNTTKVRRRRGRHDAAQGRLELGRREIARDARIAREADIELRALLIRALRDVRLPVLVVEHRTRARLRVVVELDEEGVEPQPLEDARHEEVLRLQGALRRRREDELAAEQRPQLVAHGDEGEGIELVLDVEVEAVDDEAVVAEVEGPGHVVGGHVGPVRLVQERRPRLALGGAAEADVAILLGAADAQQDLDTEPLARVDVLGDLLAVAQQRRAPPVRVHIGAAVAGEVGPRVACRAGVLGGAVHEGHGDVVGFVRLAVVDEPGVVANSVLAPVHVEPAGRDARRRSGVEALKPRCGAHIHEGDGRDDSRQDGKAGEYVGKHIKTQAIGILYKKVKDARIVRWPKPVNERTQTNVCNDQRNEVTIC